MLPLKEYIQQTMLENNRAAQIHDAVMRAWDKAVEDYPERATWKRKATFRGVFWELAVKAIEAINFADPNSDTIFVRDTANFIYDEDVLFRLKYADASLATRNYPTPEAKAFDHHDVDLYGFAGMQRVELCYVLDEFETKIIWLGIAARQRGEHLWKLEFNTSGIAPAELTLPFEEESDVAKIARIKPQPDQDEKKKKDSE